MRHYIYSQHIKHLVFNLNLLILNHCESEIEHEGNLVKWLLVPRNRLKYQECHEK